MKKSNRKSFVDFLPQQINVEQQGQVKGGTDGDGDGEIIIEEVVNG